MKLNLTKKELRILDTDELLKLYDWIAEELNTRSYNK
jgi:hypothetical protein